ncbi:hypothetical protein M569_00811, partial [Genlisea aurea]
MGRKKPTSQDEDNSIAMAGPVGKAKKKAFVVADDEYSIGSELVDRELVTEDKVVPLGNKKKGKKGAVKKSLKDDDDDEDLVEKEAVGVKSDDDAPINFSGKKKSKEKNNARVSLFASSNFGLLGDDEDDKEDDYRDDKSITQTTTPATGIDDIPSDLIESDQNVDDSEVQRKTVDPVNISKNKKKKKKGGKADQEEDDLDKILAELGIASGSKDLSEPIEASGAASLEKMEIDQPEPEEVSLEKNVDEEGPAESAAAKKKKKKKEKEKDKKAAASAPEVEEEAVKGKTEAVNKVNNKKVPKHVREMQERLAKLKEAEERKQREAEERLRKEEEERLRLEELERLAEERKRLKKEREKEKIQKKKQEGTYLTQKEKIEARRREIARNQFIANSGLIDLVTGDPVGIPAKRPLYKNKKSKPTGQTNGAATSEGAEIDDSKEIQQENQLELESIDNKKEEEDNNDGDDDDDDDDDEDWDAKSWDSVDLKLTEKSAFADEEIDTEPQPLPKKESKNAKATAQDLEMPSNKHTGLNGKASIPREDLSKEEAVKSDLSVQNGHNLRSPICCIMGHVDTGKTKLLDCIRGTNVQEGEAGGITQQIGATYFPAENIREKTRELKADAKLNVPGLLVIDTPGHESFANLRSRGSGLCDIAILVVDIMHGLEPQTIESLNLLKMRKTEFIVALNKVDRLYSWKTCRNSPITKAMKLQSKDVQSEFNSRLTGIINEFKEQGLNTELYYKNKDMGDTYNIVPTSAISGEGVPDLLLLLVQWAQKTMINRLTYKDEVQCTVLEVKVVEGHGTT